MYILPDIIEQVGRNKKTFSIPSKLFCDGVVTLFGEIDDELAYTITTQLLYLDTVESDDPIKLYINSPGGSVSAGLAIIDVMNTITRKVDTLGMGSCASMGAMILMLGTGERRSLENTRIMLHSVSGGFIGNYHDHKVTFKEEEFLQNKMIEMISLKTGVPLDDVVTFTERDKYMSAREAVDYGIIDKVVSRH